MGMLTVTLEEDKGKKAEFVTEISKCRFNFEADANDRKNGVYGFDKLTKKILKNSRPLDKEKGKGKLEQVYTPIETIGDELYYVPWLSIRKDQTVTLSLEIKVIEGDKLGTIITTGNEDKNFNIRFLNASNNETDDIEDAEKLELTCNKVSDDETKLRFRVDGLDAGGLNVFHPEPKQVNLKWYMVGRNEQEIEAIDNLISKNDLTDYCYRAFNPSLIDINILFEKAKVLNIGQEERDNFYNQLKKLTDKHIEDNDLKGDKKKIFQLKKKDEDFFTEIRKVKKEHIKNELLELCKNNGIEDANLKMSKGYVIERLFEYFEYTGNERPLKVNEKMKGRLVGNVHGVRPDAAPPDGSIYLYLSYISSYTKMEGQDQNGLEINPGASFTGNEVAFMFCGTTEEIPALCTELEIEESPKFELETDIPHEIMHSLGLEHTFSKEHFIEVRFDREETDNYMDYQNEKIHTCKWQWERMRDSQYCLPKTINNE